MELKIEHISKQFKDKTAVDDVSLTLTTGVWGLLGANGAGKTTLMRMIADIMTPSSGSISFDGEDIITIKERADQEMYHYKNERKRIKKQNNIYPANKTNDSLL